MAAVQVRRDFYKEWLMGRHAFTPQEFGVNLDRERFDEILVDAFHNAYRGGLAFDELLLHPREALRFCDEVRHANRFYDVPDDIILRTIMNRRKNPGG